MKNYSIVKEFFFKLRISVMILLFAHEIAFSIIDHLKRKGFDFAKIKNIHYKNQNW